nr:MAG TPA: major capsid protein [Caudoviricetes sp.]
MDKKKSMQRLSSNKLQRELPVNSIRALDGEGNERKVEISFSSEEPYSRWYDATEILEHSENSVDLKRLNDIGVLLFNHQRNLVIGKIIKAWVENERGYAVVEFDDDEESNKIFQKVKSGTLKGVSVGYVVNSWEEVAVNKKSSDGRFTGPCYIAKNWEPYEISIVSIPADPGVGIGRELGQGEEVNESKSSLLYLYEKQLQINKNNLAKEI